MHEPSKKMWSPEEDTKLRELVVERDLPYAQAAKILGRGRAACISRGRRLGIKKGRRIRRPGTKAPRHSAHPWRNVRLPAAYNSQYPVFGPDSPPPSPSGSPLKPHESRPTHRPKNSRAPAPKRLTELEPSECRWPVGEVPKTNMTGTEIVFCGKKSKHRKSYCKEHCERAYE